MGNEYSRFMINWNCIDYTTGKLNAVYEILSSDGELIYRNPSLAFHHSSAARTDNCCETIANPAFFQRYLENSVQLHGWLYGPGDNSA